MRLGFVDVIEILGTASFAVSGASVAIRNKLDIFGVLVIAFATAIGGGTLRDMLLGDLPVAWLQHELTVAVIFGSSVLTMVVDSSKKFPATLMLFDTLGLGLFTIVGIEKAKAFGLPPAMCIAIGTISACFGGVIRDVLLNNVPVIFRKEIYASACIAGSICYFVCQFAGVNQHVSQIVCMVTIVLIRLMAIRFRLSLPSFHLTSLK